MLPEMQRLLRQIADDVSTLRADIVALNERIDKLEDALFDATPAPEERRPFYPPSLDESDPSPSGNLVRRRSE